jgi:hypothetical protein
MCTYMYMYKYIWKQQQQQVYKYMQANGIKNMNIRLVNASIKSKQLGYLTWVHLAAGIPSTIQHQLP